MVKHLLIIFTAVAFGREVTAQPLPVRAMTITKSGQFQPDPKYGEDTPEKCARFRPTKQEWMRWFRHAHVVTSSDWFEATTWTQCSAEGTLNTGFRTYHWFVDQSGRGAVSRPGQENIYISGSELPFRSISISAPQKTVR